MIFNSPSRRLSTSLVRLRLSRFLAQSCRSIRILLSHRLPVRQILGPVHHNDQRPDLRSIHCHVGEDACGMGAIVRHFRGHAQRHVTSSVAGNDRSLRQRSARVVKAPPSESVLVKGEIRVPNRCFDLQR